MAGVSSRRKRSREKRTLGIFKAVGPIQKKKRVGASHRARRRAQGGGAGLSVKQKKGLRKREGKESPEEKTCLVGVGRGGGAR